jgi:hypothetical protein
MLSQQDSCTRQGWESYILLVTAPSGTVILIYEMGSFSGSHDSLGHGIT